MIPLPLAADKLLPQLDDVWQIQVVPLDPATFGHALKARIEAAPDVNHNRLWAARHEIPRVAVELPAAQDGSDLAVVFDFGQLAPQEILIHLHGL